MKPAKFSKIALIILLIFMPLMTNGCTLGNQCITYGLRIAFRPEPKPHREKRPGVWIFFGKPHKHERPSMVSKSFEKKTQRADRKIEK